MATTLGSSATTAQSGTVTLTDGQSIIVYTDEPLSPNETVTASRTYDGGTNYRPLDSGILCDSKVSENRLTGPGDFKIDKSATNTATQMYYDS
ncbi:hypothetical protein [uncultured Paraglaciecola sp.]|uniref:hypothetical protein n=1 Tax=uncultured Paraglaciecola sp. TaxID=1765024 RepID=UPI00260BA7DB|nr:hypothetical protein [uncultured Paraglaciecola sp.]